METFSLIIISESKLVFSGLALYCGVITHVGSLGLEAHHEPMLGILRDGSEINYTDEKGKELSVAIENGMFLFKNNACIVTVSIKKD